MKIKLSKCWPLFSTHCCRRCLEFCDTLLVISGGAAAISCRKSAFPFISLVDQWPLDDAGALCPVSSVCVINKRSQKTVSE